ncbi:MAG: 16S rRNA (cytosine(1402)-N(4))-methyltransferase RsmH [Bacteroidales bacterium]
MQNPVYHIPALLEESIHGLNITEGGTYVDATFGGGGHSRAILECLRDGRLFSFDQDEDAEKNILDDKRFTFVRGNFRFLRNFMKYYGVKRIDGLIADLGVSFHHFDETDRGFSFRFGGKLDMRMNQQGGKSAADIINTYDEERLASVLYIYGELKNSRKIASAIVKRRSIEKITDTTALIEVVSPFINRKQEKKELAQLFQALRIEVNDEMENLRTLLLQCTKLMQSGGRIAILTYHSLEDRLVKNFFRYGNFEGNAEKDFFGKTNAPLRQINNKVIVPTEEEVERNPRSRSAKLRIAEKI